MNQRKYYAKERSDLIEGTKFLGLLRSLVKFIDPKLFESINIG